MTSNWLQQKTFGHEGIVEYVSNVPITFSTSVAIYFGRSATWNLLVLYDIATKRMVMT